MLGAKAVTHQGISHGQRLEKDNTGVELPA